MIANKTHFHLKMCKCRKILELLLHIEISKFDNESKLQKTPKEREREREKVPEKHVACFFPSKGCNDDDDMQLSDVAYTFR